MSLQESTTHDQPASDDDQTDVDEPVQNLEEDDDFDDDLDDDCLDDDIPEEVDMVAAGDDPNCMYGFDGYKWSIYPSIISYHKTSSSDEMYPELKGTAKTSVFTNARQIWDLLFTEEMIERIVAGTNREIDTKRKEVPYKKTPINSTDAGEIRALFGVLYLIGAYKNANEDLSGLYATDGTGRVIFSAAISHNRLMFLLKHLRFDDTGRDDQMPDMIGLYGSFFENSQRNFTAGEYLTVDHVVTKGQTQLLVSRNPNNRVYGHSQGVKTFYVTDSMTSYVLNAHITSVTGDNLLPDFAEFSKPTQVVLQLITPLGYRNRNITAGPWYTSIELAYELQSRGHSYVGPMTQKHRQMPRDFVLKSKRRAVGSALYGFNGRMTIVSFLPKKNAPLVLLSTMHGQPKSETTGKPEIYHFYEASKTTIAATEKEAAIRAVFKYRRWESDLLNQLLDFAGINAHQIYQMTLGEIKSRDFIIALGRSLIEPELERRRQLHGLSRDLREAINKVGGFESIPELEEDEQPVVKKRRCHFCPRDRDTKIKTYCVQCKRPACKKCLKAYCEDCFRY